MLLAGAPQTLALDVSAQGSALRAELDVGYPGAARDAAHQLWGLQTPLAGRCALVEHAALSARFPLALDQGADPLLPKERESLSGDALFAVFEADGAQPSASWAFLARPSGDSGVAALRAALGLPHNAMEQFAVGPHLVTQVSAPGADPQRALFVALEPELFALSLGTPAPLKRALAAQKARCDAREVLRMNGEKLRELKAPSPWLSQLKALGRNVAAASAAVLLTPNGLRWVLSARLPEPG